jgi:hypothetical protein
VTAEAAAVAARVLILSLDLTRTAQRTCRQQVCLSSTGRSGSGQPMGGISLPWRPLQLPQQQPEQQRAPRDRHSQAQPPQTGLLLLQAWLDAALRAPPPNRLPRQEQLPLALAPRQLLAVVLPPSSSSHGSSSHRHANSSSSSSSRAVPAGRST